MTTTTPPACYYCINVLRKSLDPNYGREIDTAVCKKYTVIPRSIFFDRTKVCEFYKENPKHKKLF